MADTRSKYIPGSCLLSRRGGERGKMQVSSDDRTGNKVSIVQTRSKGGGERERKRGWKKKARSRRNTMVSTDRSFDVLFTQTGRGDFSF